VTRTLRDVQTGRGTLEVVIEEARDDRGGFVRVDIDGLGDGGFEVPVLNKAPLVLDAPAAADRLNNRIVAVVVQCYRTPRDSSERLATHSPLVFSTPKTSAIPAGSASSR
jgi:hypothetical protein